MAIIHKIKTRETIF